MSDKLKFEEWDLNYEYTGKEIPSLMAEQAWNFCQAQEQKEYALLEAEHSTILAQFSKVDLERLRLERENESLKKKLEKADFLARAFAKECPDSEKARAYLKENA